MDKITVQHYICPDTADVQLTHHLVPRSAGKILDELALEQQCTWCKRTEQDIRDDIAANGGELHPHIAGAKP